LLQVASVVPPSKTVNSFFVESVLYRICWFTISTVTKMNGCGGAGVHQHGFTFLTKKACQNLRLLPAIPRRRVHLLSVERTFRRRKLAIWSIRLSKNH